MADLDVAALMLEGIDVSAFELAVERNSVAAVPASSRVAPVARLLRLLRTLAASDGPRGLEAARLLDVAGYDAGNPKSAMASLQRDLRRLTDAGWQIENVSPEGSDARYVLFPNDLASRAGLTPGEQSVLEEALNSATGTSEIADPPGGLALARRAVDAHCVLEMTYGGRLRRVQPLRLHSAGGRWLLRARDEHDEAVKWFRIEKIEQPSLDDPGSAPEHIEDPEDSLDPHQWRIHAPTDIELEVGAGHLPYVRQTLRLPLDVADRPDGKHHFRVTITNRRALTDWLVTMGTRVRLLGPADLRRDVLAHFEAVARG
ncbi:WYL domain-containing protein [Arthrobacter sp. NEB 688]|uniref:helix-turn-helix transcriptional regulator n=1 Tax=Arthrobacter sp. NEB 688 TaxID=904039 RepID=UPI001567168A|nr:WYL domain-containing protein [Arthrobacter sp. NEB 688]QKE84397.1 WYL domain-containing protein [Arthrobacter sp. NEB 688]